ncbi:MBL fold metallo-hydrolase [Streptacidiphilus pinicola]|uniref:MBL fold metallo-hydrolase n=1 Tax=Streptacidiphilus pinicola TaxID=2219663 RepID=A0A2X0J2S6_9ACTN|nr:MBL fold metallo-hydrolase [Streptacidiphilus pinicola]RAG84516.1 MBL fold metallo-hydrolase [Streptacidiphilus pinicola]
MITDREQTFKLGDVEIVRVVEWAGPHLPGPQLVPGTPAELWERNADWLAPDHLERDSGRAVLAVQTWVLRSGGRTVLVDTGVGNGRERPSVPLFHRREGDFLDRLARAGVRPEDVDVVVNTHLHADHVGWNTTDVDGEWVPTFPNARYLLPAADHAHYGPEGGYAGGRRPDDRLIFEDSVAPVARAGQLELWEDAHRIDEHLTLEPAPGHSPGSSVLRLTSGGDRAVFVGDLLHSPVQLLDPAHNSCFCLDQAAAAATRRRILERAADLRELVVPAHFGGSGVVEVRREGDGFRAAAHG